MKATISTRGDMSVGIWPTSFTVDLEDFGDELDKEGIEETRNILSDAFSKLVGEPVTCYFDGEFEPAEVYPIVDFSEPMLNLKAQLRVAEEAALLKDYDLARKALRCARGHMVEYVVVLDQIIAKEKKNG